MRQNGYLLKLDFKKAYDIVNWDCLLELMRLWLAIAKLQILVNGVSGRDIVCKRGLCQGHPLSLLLFVLVADGLNRMLSNAKEEGMTKGLPWSSNSKFVNLQYEDGTLTFETKYNRQAIILKDILSFFELWSSLRINYHKSSMIHLAWWSSTSEFILAILECREEHLSIQ